MLKRQLTTAYQGTPSDGMLGLQGDNKQLSDLIPYTTHLPRTGRRVTVGPLTDWSSGFELMNLIIREGRTWPFEDEFTTVESYRGYFLSHTALCVQDATSDTSIEDGVASQMLGCFYIKPNFPGRCSHICNGGFITAPNVRGQGVGRLMGYVFLQAAAKLGYKGAYFNLVFASNVASIRLWESIGFERVGAIPQAARLRSMQSPYFDTAYAYYYDLRAVNEDMLQAAYPRA